MTIELPFNLLIAGVGGQGVVTLANTLWKLCDDKGFGCQGAIIKGGAQRLGRITATLRIFPGARADYECYSTDIRRGNLHLLIGLEPWESLRSHRLCSPRTRILANRAQVPLMIARSSEIAIKEPIEAMAELGLTVEAQDYTALAISNHGSRKMLNYVMGREAVRDVLRFFTLEQFDACFEQTLARNNRLAASGAPSMKRTGWRPSSDESRNL